VPDPLGPLAGVHPREASLGLYVHVPFCAVRCPFCSFVTSPLRAGLKDRYLSALRREIDLLAAATWTGRTAFETIFFGGGTPSLLEPEELAQVLDRLRTRLTVEPGAEVTVECNPESVSRARLEAYRGAGVTRVSLGVQALDDRILERLGRLYGTAGARAAFEAAREARVSQVSVDLMYGLPGLDVAGWERTVDQVLDWAPDHLSAYGLTLDAESRWGASGGPDLPSEDTAVAQYWALARRAAARGWEHYEISNYARPGCRSRHNQLYWRRREYAALGPGACGFLGRVRYVNARSTERYCAALEGGDLPVAEHEVLTDQQEVGERLILGLRTRDGVPDAWLRARTERDPALARRLETWRAGGLLEVAHGRARLTEQGFLLSDALFVEFVQVC
jgi:putative oxygen-independent coproporphyrinogen III oxidase